MIVAEESLFAAVVCRHHCVQVLNHSEGKNLLLMPELVRVFVVLMGYGWWGVAQFELYENTNWVKTHFLFFVGVPLENANADAANTTATTGHDDTVFDLHSSSSVLRWLRVWGTIEAGGSSNEQARIGQWVILEALFIAKT